MSEPRCGSRISRNGFIFIKVSGVCIKLLILYHFSYISHENEIIWSHFKGYFKTGMGRGFNRTRASGGHVFGWIKIVLRILFLDYFGEIIITCSIFL